MEEVKVGYKIVALKEGKYRPGVMHHLGVEYARDKWTFPPPEGGPLALFKKKENAVAFKRILKEPVQLWKCEYVESTERKLRFWQLEKEISTLPKGTVLAQKIKLTEIEKVEGEE